MLLSLADLVFSAVLRLLVDALQVLRDHRGSRPGYAASEDNEVGAAFHA